LNKAYCRNCEKETAYVIKTGTQESVVKGTSIHTRVEHAYCQECGAKVYVPSLSEKNLSLVDQAYRKQIGRIQLSEIQELLEQYNIGAKPLSLMLNWGECTILRYLRGQLPDKEHSDRLISLKDPEAFSNLFSERKGILTGVAKRKAERSLAAQWRQDAGDSLKKDMPKAALLLFFDQKPGDRNGNKAFQLEKLVQAILFLTQKGIPVTHLNHLLWLTDLLHYKRKDESVFGVPYRRFESVVAPDRHFWIYGALTETDISFISLQNEWIIQALHEPDFDGFSEYEREIIKNVGTLESGPAEGLIPDIREKVSTIKPLHDIPFSLAAEWIK
jgi:putative zinc finger/helix-turn-helix YgiT family protein